MGFVTEEAEDPLEKQSKEASAAFSPFRESVVVESELGSNSPESGIDVQRVLKPLSKEHAHAEMDKIFLAFDERTLEDYMTPRVLQSQRVAFVLDAPTSRVLITAGFLETVQTIVQRLSLSNYSIGVMVGSRWDLLGAVYLGQK